MRFAKLPACVLCLGPVFCPLALRAQRDLSGAAQIEQALDRLNTLGSVLMIAAHPDDENTALLAYLARGRHVRTAYLSLTRGEGGQNLIGPEQGAELGVIRTQELLAARRIDGAEQFFSRAIDFGFTKTANEALTKWGGREILSDTVWVIRRFRPDVIVLRFTGTPRDGHGQHQASAIIGKEAYFAAADPTRFPEQFKSVKPWRAKRLMWNAFTFTAEQEKELAKDKHRRVEVDTGDFDPVLGHSYSEIAGMSRSMHRSQGMGAAERRGSAKNFLINVEGDPATKDLFDGVDLTWKRVPGAANVGEALGEAWHDFDPRHPEQLIPLLEKARGALKPLADSEAGSIPAQKLKQLDETIALCAGLWLDVSADRPDLVPGGPAVKITATALDRSHVTIGLDAVKLEGMEDAPAFGLAPAVLAFNNPSEYSLNWRIPADEPYSQPYWLVKPKQGERYTVDDQLKIGMPENPPVLSARFRVRMDAQEIDLVRPVQQRYIDRVRGEMTRPLAVVPPVAVQLAEKTYIFPNDKEKLVAARVRADEPNRAGVMHLETPAGWSAKPDSEKFQLSLTGEQMEPGFQIAPPSSDTVSTLRVVADSSGRQIAVGVRIIDYPHIPPQTLFPRAEAKLVRADIRTLARKIGYVMGAGDEVPEALRQIGCEVTLLSADDLASGDLAQFDAIVTGVRAYNVRADLRANQQRLLDYVSNGGTLVVQYNVLEGGRPGSRGGSHLLDRIGPYPMKITHDRVTMEDAPVTLPHPDSPLLKEPNQIESRDFDGWVQERGLYFASEWDPRYQTLFESHDPGEKPLAGGTLVARYGKGVYVFTAYSWFRELPAGVPGAYRIFANLISAGKTLR
ncbi:MAG TPA: PIG-L family deacetylase [Bryobacteraceae bacterium]|nr:PIG-L family deacetylase [Bryobacteraceae bacterium]